MACYHVGVRKDDNSRQGRNTATKDSNDKQAVWVSYTLASIYYQDSNNAKLVYRRAKWCFNKLNARLAGEAGSEANNSEEKFEKVGANERMEWATTFCFWFTSESFWRKKGFSFYKVWARWTFPMKVHFSLSNLWVWKLAHSRLNRDVSKRQTNNLRSCFMREIFLNVFDEKVLTELKVDLRFVRRMNEPNQSGILLTNNFKWMEVNANLWAIGM